MLAYAMYMLSFLSFTCTACIDTTGTDAHSSTWVWHHWTEQDQLQVFFVRDGMKFVDLNHALKPNPKTSEPQSIQMTFNLPTVM